MAKRPTFRPRDTLLLELVAALGAGRVTEAHIDDGPDYITSGVIESGHVWVDPGPETVDTVLHELIHRMRPQWSEPYVRRRVKRLMSELEAADIETIYKIYLSVRRTRRTIRKIL